MCVQGWLQCRVVWSIHGPIFECSKMMIDTPSVH